MKGFFSSSKLITNKPIASIAHCGSCGLYKSCITPKMQPTGKGLKKILVVAEAPGKNEDEQGIQLIGKSGQHLRKVLKSLHIDLDRDCWKTNAVICRRDNNETPDSNHIAACRPNLIKTINKYQPNSIILLGAVAVESLLSYLWKEEVGAISRWGGYCIPSQQINAWIVPTFHPSFIMRVEDDVYNKFFRQHLKKVVEKSKAKPFTTIPDYKKQIEIIIKPHQAALAISDMLKKKEPIAFDYETNCTKPEYEKSEIICCSVCQSGERTIAFPWLNEAVFAMIELLNSDVPKIASNLKFEHRWTLNKLKVNVKKWLWDTMIAAHIIDNASNVTSIKYQSFVHLGVGSYNNHIQPFLESKGQSKYNRIHEIDIMDLLLYNGMDSLLEYKVALKQMKILRNRK